MLALPFVPTPSTIEATVRAAEAKGFAGIAAYSRPGGSGVIVTRGFRPGERFPVCSVTKLFTAVLVLKEVDRGRLRLEDRAAKILPEFAHSFGTTTIRDLLTHASSLANMDDAGPKDAEGTASVYRERNAYDGDPLATLRGLAKPSGTPAGTRYSYNNLDSIALAAILARVRQERYADLIKREIARPLGLSATSVLTTPFPTGVRRSKSEPVNLAVYSGAGSILSNARDLMAFGRAILRGPMLSERSRALLLSSPPRFGYIGPATFRASLESDGRTLRVVDRPGAIGEYQVRMELVPEAGTVTVLATNAEKPDLGTVYAKSGFSYHFLLSVLKR